MAENDRFEKTYRAGWRSAFIRARQDIDLYTETGDILNKALAKNLRDFDGVPGFGEIYQVIDDAMMRRILPSDQVEGDKVLLHSINRLENIVRDHGGHRHTSLAVDAAISMIANGDFAGLHSSLAERVCEAIVDNRYFANAVNHLVSLGKFTSFERADRWRQEIMQTLRPQIIRVAKQLEQNPDGKGVRAAIRQTPKKSTRSLLEENLAIADR